MTGLSRSERRMLNAIDLEARLTAVKDHAGSRVVHELRMTLAATRGTLKNVYRDNMRLRRELGLEAMPVEDANRNSEQLAAADALVGAIEKMASSPFGVDDYVYAAAKKYRKVAK